MHAQDLTPNAMRIVFHANERYAHHALAYAAFNQGLARHGLSAVLINGDVPVECDLAVFWSYRFDAVINAQKAAGRDYLVLEHGYFGDRDANWSMGFNGLNGRAEFVMGDGDRAIPELDYSTPGHNHLLIGQVAQDASVKHIDIRQWYDEIATSYPHKPLLFRPHPLQPRPHRNLTTQLGSLGLALEEAAAVITFNSNTGVDAMIAGVPVMAADEGSMVYGVAGKDEPRLPSYAERKAWAQRLSWCQWHVDEIRNGDAWATLSTRYHSLKKHPSTN